MASETVDGPDRAQNLAFSIKGNLSPLMPFLKGSRPIDRSLDPGGPGRGRTKYIRDRIFYHQDSLRLPGFLSYKQLMRGPDVQFWNLLDSVTSTGGEILLNIQSFGPFGSAGVQAQTLSHNSQLIQFLFSIMESDTLQVLRLIRESLHKIDNGTMDDVLLQQNLHSWRALISKMRAVIPDLRDSLRGFLSFTDGHLVPLPNQLLVSSALTRRLDKLDLELSSVLTLAIDTQRALSTNISIIDSKRGIAEAEAVTRLTELAVSASLLFGI